MPSLIYWIYLAFPAFFLPALFFLNGQWELPVVDILLILVFLLQVFHVRHSGRPFLSAPGLPPLLLLAAFMLLQLVPLPPLLLELVFSKTWEFYKETVWIARPGIWMPLSLAPKATALAFSHFTAWVLLYLLTVQILQDREQVKKTVSLFILSGGLIFLLGALVALNPGWCLILEKFDIFRFPGTGSTSALLSLMLPLALGLFLVVKPRVRYGSLGKRLKDLLDRPSANLHMILPFFVAFFTLFVLLSSSVAAILGSVLSTGLLALIFLSRGHKKSGLVLLLYLAFFILGAGFLAVAPASFLGKQPPIPHVDAAPGVFADHFLLGSGFGTSSDAATMGLLTDGGLVGFFLVGWFLVFLFIHTVRLWLRRRNRTSTFLYPGLLGGLLALLFSLFMVPGLSLPGTGYLFFFFAGLAVSVAHVRSRQVENPERGVIEPEILRKAMAPGALAIGLVLIFNCGIFLAKIESLPISQHEAMGIKTVERITALQKKVLKAAELDPLEPLYPFTLGRASLALGDFNNARDFYGKSVRLSPSKGEYLQALGLVFDRLGDDPKSERLLRAGLEKGGQTPDRYKIFAIWLLDKGKTEEGLEQIRNALALAPQETSEYLSLMSLYGISDREMSRVLPDKALAQLAYGDYLVKRGRGKEAEETFQVAVLYAAKEDPSDSLLFWRVYRYFLEQEKLDKALDAIQAGVRAFPTEVDFRIAAGGLYQRLGITFKAVEEYRQALLLDPGNRQVRQALVELDEGN